MKIIALIRSELKRLTATSLARLAFVALMIVPLLYGGAYLWANQNPYAKLDHIPAAIVNLDAGAKDASGDPVDYGDKVTKQLVDAKTFDWHVVSAAQAAKGIRDETYNFVFTIPASFSKDLSSTGTQDPTPAAIDLTTNDTTSYLSSTIADQAGTTIRATVTQEVSKQAASTLLIGLSDIRSNLTTAASGSGQLVNGSKQLKSGIDSAKSGAATLAAGAGQVAAGNAALNSAVSASVTTANATLAQLPATLSATAKEQQAALDSAYTKAGLSEAQENAINQVIDASHASTAATTTAQAKALTAQLSTLQTSTQKLQGGSAQVASGAASLSTGLTKLDTGAASLVSGTTKLNSGLDSGLTQIPATTAATRDKQANAIARTR